MAPRGCIFVLVCYSDGRAFTTYASVTTWAGRALNREQPELMEIFPDQIAHVAQAGTIETGKKAKKACDHQGVSHKGIPFGDVPQHFKVSAPMDLTAAPELQP